MAGLYVFGGTRITQRPAVLFTPAYITSSFFTGKQFALDPSNPALNVFFFRFRDPPQERMSSGVRPRVEQLLLLQHDSRDVARRTFRMPWQERESGRRSEKMAGQKSAVLPESFRTRYVSESNYIMLISSGARGKSCLIYLPESKECFQILIPAEWNLDPKRVRSGVCQSKKRKKLFECRNLSAAKGQGSR